MIDLRNESLPDTIEVDGRDFLIKTDFRTWLKVGEMLKEKHLLVEYNFIFVDEVPKMDYQQELIDFLLNPNSTPNYSGGDSERIFDYIEDGEFIVGSFYSQYGIDLTRENIHWHLFKALFICLEENTKMGQIMGFRGYKKSNKKYETSMMEQKNAWRLPRTKRTQEDMEEINKVFGTGWENLNGKVKD